MWWQQGTGRQCSDAMLAHGAKKWRRIAFEVARGWQASSERQTWCVDIPCRALRDNCPASISGCHLNQAALSIGTYKILQVSRRDNRPRTWAVGESFLAIGRLPSLEINRRAFQQACLKPNFVASFASLHQTLWRRPSTQSKCNVQASKAWSQIMSLYSGGSLVSSNDCDCDSGMFASVNM